jgi:hypothetical protein
MKDVIGQVSDALGEDAMRVRLPAGSDAVEID